MKVNADYSMITHYALFIQQGSTSYLCLSCSYRTKDMVKPSAGILISPWGISNLVRGVFGQVIQSAFSNQSVKTLGIFSYHCIGIQVKDDFFTLRLGVVDF